VLLGRSGRVAMALAHLRPRAAHAPGARGSHGTRGGLTPLHERGAAGRCPVQGP
jgi:hypothetical protein